MSDIQELPPHHNESQNPETTYVSSFLFHGAKNEFNYRDDYDFSDYGNDGSFTLGEGFYLTDNPINAVNYSKVRKRSNENYPVVYSADVSNCKFLDFRSYKDNQNVPVTSEMVSKWRDCFKRDLEKQIEEKPDLGPEKTVISNPGSNIQRIKINREYLVRKDLQNYLSYLDNIVSKNQSVDLREMLGTAPVPEDIETEFSGNESAPTWSKLFRRFVTKELGYDGVIFYEGTEGELSGMYPSFVVYNLDSIKVSQKPLSSDQVDSL